MKQIYETKTKGRYQILIGMTSNMYRSGKTPEEIALTIGQPVEKVLECIELCKDADKKKSEMK